MRTDTRQHVWVEIRVTEVELLEMDRKWIPIASGAEPEITYGCFLCNMGVEEGVRVDCPGEESN